MGNNAVRRTLIALLTMVMIAGLCTILVMRLQDNRSLDEDVFVVPDVNTALPATQSPDAVIKAILDGMMPTGSYRPIVVDYPFEGSIFPPEIVTPRFLWHDDAEDAGLWLVDSSFDTGPHHIYALTGGRVAERSIDPGE